MLEQRVLTHDVNKNPVASMAGFNAMAGSDVDALLFCAVLGSEFFLLLLFLTLSISLCHSISLILISLSRGYGRTLKSYFFLLFTPAGAKENIQLMAPATGLKDLIVPYYK